MFLRNRGKSRITKGFEKYSERSYTAETNVEIQIC